MTSIKTAAKQNNIPTYKAVAMEIETMIAQGSLKPGKPLPNEMIMAAEFNVNRSTIRESIRLLEDTGYVSRISPRKLVAAIPNAKSLVSRASRALYVNGVTMRQIWETTFTVEPQLAKYAALRATDEQIKALRANVDETKYRNKHNEDISDLDESFHTILGEASNHTALLIAMEPYKALFMPVVDSLGYSNGAGERLAHAHDMIVEAIERRDPVIAELWSRRHLEDFERGCKLANVNIDLPFDKTALEKIK